MQVFDVEPLVEEIRETVQPLADRNGNALEIRLEEGTAPVEADPIRLKQCLLNLLSNACKFTKNGEVVLTIAEERQADAAFVVFSVQDTGIGLTSDQIQRLFQPFVQADASTTRQFGGTGLGLAITKKLCEAMKGEIAVVSEPGVGSTFRIAIPACGSSLDRDDATSEELCFASSQ